MNLEDVKNDVKKVLSEKRYNHSIGTMKKARELALIYGENEEEASFAGLIHDIAKEMTKEEILDYTKKHNIEMDEIEEENLGLMHAKLGASIAKEKYGASEKVQNAIKYHTTGNENMDTFAKIIYIADKIEENRIYEGIDTLRRIVEIDEDLDKAILILIDFVIDKSEKKGTTIHPDTIDLKNKLLKKA